MREDSYSEATSRFADLDGAVRCMLDDCAFDVPPDLQPPLFPEES
jgi:hypothetical protein